MKIVILVDSLSSRGGVQRIVLLMANVFNADIYAGKYSPEETFQEFKELPITVLSKRKLPQRVGSIFVKYKFKNLDIPKYDLYVLCGGYSLYFAKKHHPNIWWSIAPRKWLYDLYEEEKKKFGFVKRQIFKIFSHFLRKEDQKNIKNIDIIISISKNVKHRIKKTYGKDSVLIYPGSKIKNLRYLKTGDFYLSTARLTPDKRVDTIVEAFKKMPNKKLVVISSGTEFEKIKKLASGHENIDVLGKVSNTELAKLYGECIATIYASYHEDFGLVAVESMAAGKPVIASGDMGFAETIINKKTGFLINPTTKNIVSAVKKLTPKKAKLMRFACEQRAKQFSEEEFITQLKKVIKDTVDKY